MRIRVVTCLFVIAVCADAFPCTCMGPPDAKTTREVAEWYAKQADIDLIFQGKVIKQELHNGSVGPPSTAMSMTGAGQFRTVSFAVTRVFRGDKQDHISVITGLGTSDCGYVFRTSQSYLVYASAGPAGGKVHQPGTINLAMLLQ